MLAEAFNNEYDKLLKEIQELCKVCSLVLEEREKGSLKIFTDHASGISLYINVKSSSDFSFYYLVRTYDILYNGDRTDAHVILSLMFSSFLKVINPGMSCGLYDIPHPMIEDEIWGRYIVPEQAPSYLTASSWSELSKILSRCVLLLNIWRENFWKFAACPCEECLKKNDITDNFRDYDTSEEMLSAITFLPLLGALIILFLNKNDKEYKHKHRSFPLIIIFGQ